MKFKQKLKWVIFRWLCKNNAIVGRPDLIPTNGAVVDALSKFAGRQFDSGDQVEEFANALIVEHPELAGTSKETKDRNRAIAEANWLAGEEKRARKRERKKRKKEFQKLFPPKPTFDAAYSPENYRLLLDSPEWRQLRYLVLRAANGACALCGKSRKQGVILHVDHIIPASVDWSKRLEYSNLQVLCEACNLGKSNRYCDDWR